ncbi:hypothetical protein [Actinomadura sp. 9N407]|uniref:hypothetical protein n=1 Tax=Actinomadura sp. 9N407 TaxID=3375154 RepID=UPI0037962BF5
MAIADAETASTEDGEKRYFVDKALAETAYGEDLAQYLAAPYEGHALSRSASWVQAASDLGIGVAAAACLDSNVAPSGALAAARRRQDNHQYDAVLADSLRVCSELGTGERSVRSDFLIEGVIFPFLGLSGNDPILSRAVFSDCVIEVLDISDVETNDRMPTFQNTVIGHLDGVSGVPAWLSTNFSDSDIESFSPPNRTTAAIMELKIPPERRVALTILKKIYTQPGGGRKEGALSRGIDMRSRELVPDVINKLVSGGWIARASGSSDPLYVQMKGLKAKVVHVLDDPTSFHF